MAVGSNPSHTRLSSVSPLPRHLLQSSNSSFIPPVIHSNLYLKPAQGQTLCQVLGHRDQPDPGSASERSCEQGSKSVMFPPWRLSGEREAVSPAAMQTYHMNRRCSRWMAQVLLTGDRHSWTLACRGEQGRKCRFQNLPGADGSRESGFWWQSGWPSPLLPMILLCWNTWGHSWGLGEPCGLQRRPFLALGELCWRKPSPRLPRPWVQLPEARAVPTQTLSTDQRFQTHPGWEPAWATTGEY